MAGRRVHFVFPVGLVERVDARLGPGQSRGGFVRDAIEIALRQAELAEAMARDESGEYQRRAVERALDESSVSGGRGARGRLAGEVHATLPAGGSSVVSPAPAEQPEKPSNFERLQGARPAREFRPYPKGGGG